MTDAELRQLIESNARAIQAMLDAWAEERLRFEEFRQRSAQQIERLENIALRLTIVQEGMARMLGSLAGF